MEPRQTIDLEKAFWDRAGQVRWSRSCRSSSLARLPSSVGIEPVRLLLRSHSLVRLVRLPSSGGIEPVSSLALSHSRSRLVRFPSQAGIEPVSSLLPSLKARKALEVAEFRRDGTHQVVVPEEMQHRPGW